ncbi:MAG: hypothetical protein LAT81_02370 [Oceanicaulis sp.]|nr:hypothetical protein [Oceanicaulis sp.]
MTLWRNLLLAGSACLLTLTVFSPPPVWAQPGGVAAPAFNEQALEILPAFIDGVMAQQIASRGVSGALVTVVHGGELVLSRG